MIRSLRRRWGLAAAALAVAALGFAAIPQTANAATGFVTRSGTHLTLNGLPYRMLGFNEWRAAVTSWNKPNNTGYLVNDGTTLNDGLVEQHSHAPHLNVMRFWAFQQFALPSAGNPTPPPTWNFAAIDKAISTAAAQGFKVIVNLEDNNAWQRTSPVSADPPLSTAWYQTGYTSTVLPYEAVPYSQWVQTFAQHEGDNPNIAVWELVNEPDVSGNRGVSCPSNAGSIAAAFAQANATTIHTYAPHALVSAGTAGEVCGFNHADMNTVLSQPGIALGSFHDYTGAANAGGTWPGGNGLNDECSRAVAVGKPVYAGEIGIHLNGAPVNGNPTARSTYLNAKLSTQFGYNSGNCLVGALPWGYDKRGSNAVGSDDYEYPYAAGASDPGYGVLDSYHL
jgi:hypothetical protein